MRMLILGLDCAAPEILFGDPQLKNLRRLMAGGTWGRLESVVPPITVPAWMCLATGQDPGALGVYGFRNRRDWSYGGLEVVHSGSFQAEALWDQVADRGGRCVLLGVPPNWPPRRVNGCSVGCFLTPDADGVPFTEPPEWSDEIRRLLGCYAPDVRGFRTENKPWLLEQILDLSRRQWRLARHLMRRVDWDYFHFVDIGLDRLQHGFWRFHDPLHRLHQPGNPFEHVIRDHYRRLDEELGRTLELLDEETIVLVASDHGATRLEGGFCINEWLIREGFLTLHSRPNAPTPLAKAGPDWGRTLAWSEGGYYARIFLNVRGREPQGTIDPADYDRVRNELQARLEATRDHEGRPLGTIVFRPEEIYSTLRGHPPDLIVHLGGLRWRSIGGVGYPEVHTFENDTGPDDCNHAQHGAFVLQAPGLAPRGEVAGTRLLDVAPLLAEHAGFDWAAAPAGA